MPNGIFFNEVSLLKKNNIGICLFIFVSDIIPPCPEWLREKIKSENVKVVGIGGDTCLFRYIYLMKDKYYFTEEVLIKSYLKVKIVISPSTTFQKLPIQVLDITADEALAYSFAGLLPCRYFLGEMEF